MKQMNERAALLEESGAAPAPYLEGLTSYDTNSNGRNDSHRCRRAALVTTALLGVAAFAGTRAYTSGPEAPAKNLAWTAFFTNSMMSKTGSASAYNSPDPETATITVDDADDACVVTTSPANDVSRAFR